MTEIANDVTKQYLNRIETTSSVVNGKLTALQAMGTIAKGDMFTLGLDHGSVSLVVMLLPDGTPVGVGRDDFYAAQEMIKLWEGKELHFCLERQND